MCWLLLLISATALAQQRPDAWHVPALQPPPLDADLGWSTANASGAHRAAAAHHVMTFFEQLYDAVASQDAEALMQMLAADVTFSAHTCEACGQFAADEGGSLLTMRQQATCRGPTEVIACLEREADERQAMCASLRCSSVSYRISVLSEHNRIQVARVLESYSGGGASTSLGTPTRMLTIYYLFLRHTDATHVRVRALESLRTAVAPDYEPPSFREWSPPPKQ